MDRLVWGGAALAIALGFGLNPGGVMASVETGAAAVRTASLVQPSMPETIGGAADLRLRYVQEDGPSSGHVRVLLTPETRSLTVLLARSAAQQAFLQALDEPGVRDGLSRVIVEVALMPEQRDVGMHRTFRFVSKGEHTWSILPGE
ncbi:hypothetical protein SAMN05216548_1107 [Faunimonas pinastri]|uniref:Uncharacterized protein n=1 Tax=Faunimonas pinastri TaxID=1855383 RepID=A0A1H9KLS5_9HYPH|nr:hypothetical protein [Faunimonas pinastri]SEQ99875.1 hypothetical protein SAMN05216548_1107 [Faunimonas pinastri]